MRTTQRNFVVEYKNRRQAQARSPSIWGNLDLRAVALQIETDGGLPDAARSDVQSVVNAEVRGLESASSIEPRVQTGSNRAGGDDLVLREPPDELPASVTSAADVNRPIAGKSTRSSKPDKRAPIHERAVGGGFEVFAQDNGEDDLDALEEENRRLKGLMMVKLRQENAELRSMLKRFDIE